MMRAYKYKLKPSAKTIAIFEMWLQLLCELYNAALQERRDAYKISHKSISYKEQSSQLPEIKKEREDVGRIYSQVIQETLKRVERAFENFFRRLKEKKSKAGYPRFRSSLRYDSFTYPQSGFELDQKRKKLRLSKIGTMKILLSRQIKGQIKTCTIKREADGYYVVFAVEEKQEQLTEKKPEIVLGIDVGLKTFATLSTGEEIVNPRHLRKSESELKKAQRRVSRRKKKSNRRRKSIKLLARRHQTIARQRRDFFFKQALKLVRIYTLIKFENLNIAGMMKNHHLAKSIADAGWGTFILIVAHKAENAGGRVDKVNANGTTTRCSRCGRSQKMPLHIRIFRCGNCGLVIDRDHNSGINIKEREGRAVLSGRRRVAVVEEPRTYRPTESESPTITRSV